MTRVTSNYTDGNFNEYEVEYKYFLGRLGNYFDPPEPHELEVLEVYDLQNRQVVTDEELIEEIEEYFYNKLNDN
jgi:hypothetical protein